MARRERQMAVKLSICEESDIVTTIRRLEIVA
jgi:hypothetical protein